VFVWIADVWSIVIDDTVCASQLCESDFSKLVNIFQSILIFAVPLVESKSVQENGGKY
jgi:hypothetical protein